MNDICTDLMNDICEIIFYSPSAFTLPLLCLIGPHGLVYLYGLVFPIKTDVARFHLLQDSCCWPNECTLNVFLVFS